MRVDTPSARRIVSRLPEYAKRPLRRALALRSWVLLRLPRVGRGRGAQRAAAMVRILRQSGDAAAARASVNRALDRWPQDIVLHRESISVARMSDDWHAVIDAIYAIEAIALESGDALTSNDLRQGAIAQRKLGLLGEARLALDRAIAIDPHDAYTVREDVRLCRVEGRWDRLIASVLRLEKLEGPVLESAFRCHQSFALRRLGDYAAARAVILSSQVDFPEKSDLLTEERALAVEQCCWNEAYMRWRSNVALAEAPGKEIRVALGWLDQMRAFAGSMCWDVTCQLLRFVNVDELRPSGAGSDWISTEYAELLSVLHEFHRSRAIDVLRTAKEVARAGSPLEAENLLTVALASDCHWHDYRELRVRHEAEFLLESLKRAHRTTTEIDVMQSIFIDNEALRIQSAERTIALVRAEVHAMGLRVSGHVFEPNTHVNICASGVLLRKLRGSGSPWSFRFDVNRTVPSGWPPATELTVAVIAEDGDSWSTMFGVEVRSSASEIGEALPSSLNKKGSRRTIGALSSNETESLLAWAAHLDEFFRNELDRPLFITYGTLLGIVRDGQLLDHDDDFDMGYVSPGASPSEVRRDTAYVVRTLLKAGYDTHVGRTLRPAIPGSADSPIPVDILPCWFGDGFFWGYGPPVALDRSDIEPLEALEYEGVRLSMPRRPELLLQRHYGTTWIYPDSGFGYEPASIPASQRNRSDSALLGISDIRAIERDLMQRRAVERLADREVSTTNAARLVSYFGQPLYPLKDFVHYG